MKKNLRLIISVFSSLVILFSGQLLFAESVFLKDGAIIEGKIFADSDESLKIRLPDKKEQEIKRKDVLRILYHDNYKQKFYMYKLDGQTLEVYIIDENKENYTYRTDLHSAREVTIPKKEVNALAKQKLVVKVEKENKKKEPPAKEKLISGSPRFRIGIGVSGAESDYTKLAQKKGTILNLDIFLYRMRNEQGNGFDFFSRGLIKIYADIQDVEMSSNDANEIFNPKNGISSNSPVYFTEWSQVSLGVGLRYARNLSLIGFRWQGYLLGYFQYSMFRAHLLINNYDTLIDSTSRGLVAGVGLEMTLSPGFGLFLETTMGYSPFTTSKNAESQSIILGMSWRTSHW
jgi:hypothetical protein